MQEGNRRRKRKRRRRTEGYQLARGTEASSGSGLGQTRPVLLCDKEKWQQMRKNNATARTTGELTGGEQWVSGGCITMAKNIG